MLKLFKYLKKREWVYLVCALIFVVAGVGFDLTLPDYMREITTLVQTEGSALSDVLIAGGKMLACAFLSLATTFIVGYFSAKVAAGLALTLREKVFFKTIDFSKAEMSKFSVASLITRTTNDVQQIQLTIAIGLQAVCRAPIMAIWAALKIMNKSWQWGAITAGAVVILVFVMGTVTAIVMPKFRMMQKLTDNLNKVSRENLTGIRVVRAYNAQDYQQAKFEKANDDLTSTQLFTSRRMSLMFPTVSLVMSGLTLAIYWSGVFIINDAAFPQRLSLFSDMVVFSSYAIQIVMSFMMIVMVFVLVPRAMVAAKRIDEVVKTESSIKGGADDAENASEQGTIKFKNVTFKYPDAEEAILHDINLNIKKGETVAFIGSTGSGKSTLIQLIPRFYNCTEGEILVDGIDVNSLTLKSLRDKVGFVSQKPILFKGTIEDNVAYGTEGEIDEAKVKEALDIAMASEFVFADPKGIKQDVSQAGSNFSGGQKQRLSIARAVYKNPEIFIFDDSFSALDYKTDRALRKALAEKTKDSTKLIVAQRIGTIMDADQIFVLDEGRIVGHGTHSELLKTCEVYKEIAQSQLSEEELENASR
ncbi:MAG: ABC transporter ATP-binding protein [Phoenicibacter congonensis]|uniref:ABC transporter ATP-binding protein n=1 Tax=Phoenicibacter congonensis TaxID=1944646 RepID=A0AA43RI76_9ACTN|nr:ABC transporter ATP-binding protein [Phoenicibacter congonensis]